MILCGLITSCVQGCMWPLDCMLDTPVLSHIWLFAYDYHWRDSPTDYIRALEYFYWWSQVLFAEERTSSNNKRRLFPITKRKKQSFLPDLANRIIIFQKVSVISDCNRPFIYDIFSSWKHRWVENSISGTICYIYMMAEAVGDNTPQLKTVWHPIMWTLRQFNHQVWMNPMRESAFPLSSFNSFTPFISMWQRNGWQYLWLWWLSQESWCSQKAIRLFQSFQGKGCFLTKKWIGEL